MAKKKGRKKVAKGLRFGLLARLRFLWTGSLGSIKATKPKRKTKKKVATDASKGRKRIPKSLTSVAGL